MEISDLTMYRAIGKRGHPSPENREWVEHKKKQKEEEEEKNSIWKQRERNHMENLLRA